MFLKKTQIYLEKHYTLFFKKNLFPFYPIFFKKIKRKKSSNLLKKNLISNSKKKVYLKTIIKIKTQFIIKGNSILLKKNSIQFYSKNVFFYNLVKNKNYF